jgi:hypothetical protein
MSNTKDRSGGAAAAERAQPLPVPLAERARVGDTDEPRADEGLDLDPGPDGERAYEGLVRRQLALLGEDPARDGLLNTPKRVANAMAWLTRGYALDARDVIGDALFDETHESMVLVRDIELYSM